MVLIKKLPEEVTALVVSVSMFLSFSPGCLKQLRGPKMLGDQPSFASLGRVSVITCVVKTL